MLFHFGYTIWILDFWTYYAAKRSEVMQIAELIYGNRVALQGLQFFGLGKVAHRPSTDKPVSNRTSY